MAMLKKIAIIGSGICGAYLANALAIKCEDDENAEIGVCEQSHEVYVFEKARGLGGRSAAKRQGEISFDYGVSYFSIQDADLKSFLIDSLFHENIELVNGKTIELDLSDKENSGKRIIHSSSEKLFVSKPYGNSFVKVLLKDIKNIFLETKIYGVLKKDSKYKLVLENADEFDVDFDIIISTAPAAQSAQIYSEYDDLVKSLSKVKYNPAFVLMFSFKQSVAVFSALVVSESISKIRNADILKIKNSIIEEIVFNHKKPLRDSSTPAFVIKASESFTENNLEMEYAVIEEALLNEFFSIMGFDLDSRVELDFKQLHRWLYSTPSNTVKEYADLKPRNLDDHDIIFREYNSERLFLKAEDEELYALGDYVLGAPSDFINDQNDFMKTDSKHIGLGGVEQSLLSAKALVQILNFS